MIILHFRPPFGSLSHFWGPTCRASVAATLNAILTFAYGCTQWHDASSVPWRSVDGLHTTPSIIDMLYDSVVLTWSLCAVNRALAWRKKRQQTELRIKSLTWQTGMSAASATLFSATAIMIVVWLDITRSFGLPQHLSRECALLLIAGTSGLFQFALDWMLAPISLWLSCKRG